MSKTFRSFADKNPEIQRLKRFLLSEASKVEGCIRSESWSIDTYVSLFLAGRLDVYPEYQRGVVMDKEWAHDLIDTLRHTQWPLNRVLVREDARADGSSVYEVVDGAQRLGSILLFAMGALMVSNDGGNEWLRMDPADPDRGWFTYFGRGDEDFVHDSGAVKVYDTMMKFRKEVESKGLLADIDAGFESYPEGLAAVLFDRSVATVVCPSGWSSKLCMLYAMYEEIKHLRQSKDECIIHLHDNATRSLKPLESPLRIVMQRFRKSDFYAGSRREYGCIFRVFHMFTEDNVPMDSDERSFLGLMCTTVERYYVARPDPNHVSLLERGIRLMGSVFDEETARRFKSRIRTDHVCVLLYMLCTSRRDVPHRKVIEVLRFMTRKTSEDRARYAERLCSDHRRLADEYTEARRARNLKGMCLAISRRANTD